METYSETDIAAAIERDATAWAGFFNVTDPDQIENRRRVMRSNVAVGFFEPLLRVGLTPKLIYHATAPFSLFCDDGVVARPFWTFEDATQMVANFRAHSFRIFERQADGSMQDIFYMPAALPPA